MNAGPTEPQEVPVDVMPPLPKDAPLPPPPPPAGDSSVPFANLRTFYHPASGVVILGLDWLAFGTDFFTGAIAIPIVCVLSFLVSFALVFAVQRKWTRDTVSAALGKSFLGAFLVGLAFPDHRNHARRRHLVLSGLPHHPVDMVRKIAERSAAR